MDILSYAIIFLLSLLLGMGVGLILKSKPLYHGPNAEKEIQKKFYSKKLGKCIQFGIESVNCSKK